MSSTTCQRIFAQSIIDPYNCNRIRMTSTCHNTSTQSHCIAQQQPVSTHLNGCLRTSTYSRLANKLPTNLAYTLTTTFDLSTFCTQLSSAFCYCYLFLNFFVYFCLSISFHSICQSYACARRQLSLLSAAKSTTVSQVNRCHCHWLVYEVVESSTQHLAIVVIINDSAAFNRVVTSYARLVVRMAPFVARTGFHY